MALYFPAKIAVMPHLMALRRAVVPGAPSFIDAQQHITKTGACRRSRLMHRGALVDIAFLGDKMPTLVLYAIMTGRLMYRASP